MVFGLNSLSIKYCLYYFFARNVLYKYYRLEKIIVYNKQ